MNFTINEQLYRDTFERTKKGFQHSKGNHLKLFPFATDMKNFSDSRTEMKNFHGIAGKFCRFCLALQQPAKFSKEALIESIVESVDSERKTDLSRIINELLFDEDRNLVLFDQKILPYLTLNNPNSKLESLENFISRTLTDKQTKALLTTTIDENEKTNIFYQLILDHFKKLVAKEDIASEDLSYYQGPIVLEIREMMNTDLSNLITNKAMFTANITSLIKFYYFIFVLRMVNSILPMFSDEKYAPLFFSLEWEKLSKSRIAIDNGWRRLEYIVEPLFAHANCIELLNTLNTPKSGTFPSNFIYSDLLKEVKAMDEDSEKELTRAINQYINRYEESIKDVSWSEFHESYKFPEGDNYHNFHSLSLVHKLFNMIKYQFEKSATRRPAYQSFSKWFKEFVKLNYYKTRGSLGGTLKIDKETLLLFTELSIMSTGKEKILTSQLWLELEKRDILLDNQSKKETILFFEKINILEKKSDSGDAQYVKRLHK
jgi:DNA phosphorothioation-dependent restriction protein DptG